MEKTEYTAPSVIPDPEAGERPFIPQSDKVEAWWQAAGIFRPVPRVRKTRADGGFLIVMAGNLLLYLLNESAKKAFLLMDGQRDLPCIAEEMAGLYRVERTRLDRDLKVLAYTLERYGLIGPA